MDKTIFSGMLIVSFVVTLSGCNNAAGDGDFQAYKKLVPKNELEDSSPKNQQSKPVLEKQPQKTANKKSLAEQSPQLVKTENNRLTNIEKPVPANRKVTKNPESSFAELLISAAIGHTASAVATEETSNNATAALAFAPRVMKILISENNFTVAGPEGAIRVSYDDINLLKVMNLEPVTATAPSEMPVWLKNLNGKRIRIRGFMSPTFTASGLTSFLLGRDNQACCFPGQAKIYDLFRVKMRDGQTVDFIDNRPFDVVGIFRIDPWVEDGELWELYHITDATIIAH